ncbi:MAG: T9SS type A sorting domain-containing protein [Bacteroidetes bacterium]|nr:T9SS type A sorting domain-containing protein [Bacteroidota bacterium]
MVRPRTLVLLYIFVLSPTLVTPQSMPRVYTVENTCPECPKPYFPSFAELPEIQYLPDPFAWADGRGRIENFSDWRVRRAEISALVQQYEIGWKPQPPLPGNLQATLINDTLRVTITEGTTSITIRAIVKMPTSGVGPYPAVIGVGWSGTGSLPSDIFTSRGIATIQYLFSDVAPWTQSARGLGNFYKLYPDTKVGYFTAWAWGVSRIIDGLERIPNSNIDLQRLAITGCSFAGKIALFSGALDERIALTIAQEPGGGGDATWRFSQTLGSSVEILSNAQSYFWYHQDLSQFNNAVTKLPFDHHQVMALIAPRALLVIGNPSMVWLAEESGYVGCRAAHQVWNALGVPDRFGFSKVGHSDHCVLPVVQRPEVIAFVEKFLLGIDTVNTNVAIHPGYTTNLSPWIPWSTPTLRNDTSYFGRTTLITPNNVMIDPDSLTLFVWQRKPEAERYYIQFSLSPLFTTTFASDSTTDTLIAKTGFVKGKKLYWRVRVKTTEGKYGPWSDFLSFTTKIPLPPKVVLAGIKQASPTRNDFLFRWRKTLYADQYQIQVSESRSFLSIYYGSVLTDTSKVYSNFMNGKTYYWRVRALNMAGEGPWSDIDSFLVVIVGINKNDYPPDTYALHQNFPNPFNPTTKVRFELPQRVSTKITVYDIRGRELYTVLNQLLDPGYHEVTIDATYLQSGMYFYRIEAGSFTQTRKMVVVK